MTRLDEQVEAINYLERFIDGMKDVYFHENDEDKQERALMMADAVKEDFYAFINSRKEFERIRDKTISIRSNFLNGMEFHLERTRLLQQALGRLVDFEYRVKLLEEKIEEEKNEH